MYKLVWTKYFTKRAKKFIRNHPDLKGRLACVLRDLETDPTRPSLKIHSLKGGLEGLHAVSLTYSYQITLTLKITEREIILIDIGSHDDVYR
jgi:mRNA-degrading endonuclease YafQ of YafQ-DinJ toxin-antitoxin module